MAPKLAYAVHERWPLIKIILVSGQLKLTDNDKHPKSRFFGKPLDVKQMIAEMQDMMGKGSLKIVPDDVAALIAKAPHPVSNGTAVRPAAANATSEEFLTAENDSLRLLLEQAGIDAKVLLAQAGIDAKEREAADKLQKLILEELHHRIKNTLATVSAIASQSLRTATSIEHGQHAIEGRLVALGRAHDLLLQARWANASLEQTIRGATEPYVSIGSGRISIQGPDIRITLAYQATGFVYVLNVPMALLVARARRYPLRLSERSHQFWRGIIAKDLRWNLTNYDWKINAADNQGEYLRIPSMALGYTNCPTFWIVWMRLDPINTIRERFEISQNRYARRAADWLVGSSDGQLYGIQRQFLRHSLMKKETLFVGILFTTLMALTAATISGRGWAYAWLSAEIVLGSVRLAVLNSFEKAEARGKVGDAIAPVVAGLAWVIVLSAAYYLCVASNEWILILLAGIGLAGILGGVSSRNAGTPRYGIIVMCLVALPYSLAAIMSPMPYLFVVGLQIPLCLAGMILVLLENYKILLGLYQAEQENLRLAHHDPLTGLPNRIMTRERLNQLLRGPLFSTSGPEHFTVFCLDLDGFKEVNDRFGHAIGDAVLIAVARRLRDSVREQDFVCRVGGDEFVVLLPSLSAGEAASIARRVIDKISKPYEIGLSTQPRVGISIGGACAPQNGVNADELLRSADHALYEAKRRGKGAYVAQPASISETVELAPSADADARLALDFLVGNGAGATAGRGT